MRNLDSGVVMNLPIVPFVRFLVDGVVFSIPFSTDSIAVCHSLPGAVIDRMSTADIWRCDGGRCREMTHDRCPCNRIGADEKADSWLFAADMRECYRRAEEIEDG